MVEVWGSRMSEDGDFDSEWKEQVKTNVSMCMANCVKGDKEVYL